MSLTVGCSRGLEDFLSNPSVSLEHDLVTVKTGIYTARISINIFCLFKKILIFAALLRFYTLKMWYKMNH